jgi:hypothetical protein
MRRCARQPSRGSIVLHKLLFVAACLFLPVAWGVLVNWVFDVWQARAHDKTDDEPLFPDFQI